MYKINTIIRYIDYLSPRITFYYKGHLSHSSIFSGILSAVSIIFVISFMFYFLLDIIHRTNPNTFYYKTFEEDVGIYQINTSSLFHFINIQNFEKGISVNEGFDFTAFNIIGLQVYIDSYLNNVLKDGITIKDHWIYGFCDIEKNTDGLDNLLIYDFFEKSACIKSYYSKKDNKYYDLGDPNFVWPTIKHGTINENNQLYSIIIQKCDNTTLKHILGNDAKCKTDLELEKYLDRITKYFHFYFINNYINVLNYSYPNSQSFYRLETPIKQIQYSTNDININPIHIKTNDGLILDNINELASYMFDRNDVYIREKKESNNNLYVCYCFFLKNIVENYERRYKRIQDVISSIGGINQAVYIIAIYLNAVYNNYIVLSDNEVLLNHAICSEKKMHKRRAVRFNNNIKPKVGLEKIDKKELMKKSITERKNFDNIDTENTEKKLSKNSYLLRLATINNQEGIDNIENFKKDNYKYKKKKQFWNYLLFKITWGKKNKFFHIYEDFRIKIISEEHLIRNHLNIYNLLKVTEGKRRARKNSYNINDLIKMV